MGMADVSCDRCVHTVSQHRSDGPERVKCAVPGCECVRGPARRDDLTDKIADLEEQLKARKEAALRYLLERNNAVVEVQTLKQERYVARAERDACKALLVEVDHNLRGALTWAGSQWGSPESVRWVVQGVIDVIQKKAASSTQDDLDDLQTAHELLDQIGIRRHDPDMVSSGDDPLLSLTGRLQDLVSEFIKCGPHGDAHRATVIWQDDEQVTQAAWDRLYAQSKEAIQLLENLLEEIDIPESNCSCHLHPPCGDCARYGLLRELRTQVAILIESVKRS